MVFKYEIVTSDPAVSSQIMSKIPNSVEMDADNILRHSDSEGLLFHVHYIDSWLIASDVYSGEELREGKKYICDK